MKKDDFFFANPDQYQLSGTLYTDNAVKALAIIVPCFTCTKEIPVIQRLASELTSKQFAVLTFDPTGIGKSDGNLTANSLLEHVDDTRTAASWLIHQFPGKPLVLVGHSIGGAISIEAAMHIPEVRALATIGAPANHQHLVKMLRTYALKTYADDSIDVQIGGKEFHFDKDFLDQLLKQNILSSASKLESPLLVLHSPEDEVVPYEHGLQLFETAHVPKGFISLDKMDHLIKYPSEVAYCAQLIVSWCSRFLSTNLDINNYD